MNGLWDEKIIKKVKDATVAIGLAKVNSTVPEIVIGSGFIFDSRGYIVTAAHVAEKIVKVQKRKNFGKKAKDKVNVVYFRPILEKDATGYKIHDLNIFHLVNYQKIYEDSTMPKCLDFAYAKPIKEESSLPFLDITKKMRLPLSSEIMLSSFPSGDHTFRLKPIEFEGERYNPVIQFGKIGGYLPTDSDPAAYAIQMDIIGTGGSSGGAIVNTDGKIISIATNVIPANFKSKDKTISGSVLFGTMSGISSLIISILIETAREHLETGIYNPPKLPQSQFIRGKN